MSFFFNTTRTEAKAKPKKVRLQDIPVASLQKLGCSVCPRDKDKELKSPKMEPSGRMGAPIYLLGSAPSEDEDADNNHWTDKPGNAIYQMFGSSFMKKSVRSNFITQCRGEQTNIEIECCRNRIVSDIEACKPEIVVTIGDAPLAWATGITGGATTNRGQMFVAKFGRHTCWVFSILYPNYVFKKSGRKSEYQTALEHDIERIKSRTGELFAPRVYEAPYDTGIEIITGESAGDYKRLEDALNRIARYVRSTTDIETTGLRPYMLRDARLLTASVGTYADTVAFPIEWPEAWGSERKRRDVMALYRDYLLHSGRKGAHNLAFEMEWYAFKFGPEFLRRTEWDDTMALTHTLDERPGTQSLDYQTRKHFGFNLKEQSRIDVTRDKWWEEYPLAETLRYNGMDVKWADLLRDTLEPEVRTNPAYAAEYERKMRLAPTLVRTETIGLLVDFEYAEKQKERLVDSLRGVERKLAKLPEIRTFEQRFGKFQPTNHDQVLKLYRDVVPQDAVRVEERDGKVRWTTEEEALQKIELPSAHLILEHRGSAKLLSTYIEPVLKREIVCHDDRIRCKYSQMRAVTGRLASEDPNLQNFPARKNKEVRGMIVPPPGCWIAPFDYGQIEFRVVGMASEDANLVKYCWTGYDVHGDWAARIARKHGPVKDYIWKEFQDTIRAAMKKDPDEDKAIMKALRQEAKNGWVFPMFFGSSARSCAEGLHIPEDKADDLKEEFWDEFRGVKKWQERILLRYERTLDVETLGGRKRRGAMSLNQIINLPIQGTALDIVTEAMNVLSERSEYDEDPELQPVLNVHDDLTFYLHDDTIEQKMHIIAREMCLPRFDYINVPLIVEVKAGKRWHDVEEIKVFRSNELFGTPNPYAP